VGLETRSDPQGRADEKWVSQCKCIRHWGQPRVAGKPQKGAVVRREDNANSGAIAPRGKNDGNEPRNKVRTSHERQMAGDVAFKKTKSPFR